MAISVKTVEAFVNQNPLYERVYQYLRNDNERTCLAVSDYQIPTNMRNLLLVQPHSGCTGVRASRIGLVFAIPFVGTFEPPADSCAMCRLMRQHGLQLLHLRRGCLGKMPASSSAF